MRRTNLKGGPSGFALVMRPSSLEIIEAAKEPGGPARVEFEGRTGLMYSDFGIDGDPVQRAANRAANRGKWEPYEKRRTHR